MHQAKGRRSEVAVVVAVKPQRGDPRYGAVGAGGIHQVGGPGSARVLPQSASEVDESLDPRIVEGAEGERGPAAVRLVQHQDVVLVRIGLRDDVVEDRSNVLGLLAAVAFYVA